MIIDQFFNYLKKNRDKKPDKLINSDKPIRSIVKAVSWRMVGTIDTIVISWIITGKVTLALTIGSIELVTKMVLYFLHERIWNVIKWGKQ